MEKLIVSAQLMQAILNYLSSKPYGEVHQLVAEIIKLEKAETPIVKDEA